MTVQLNINVPHLKTTEQARTYCTSLAQEIVKLPMNEDCGIKRIIYSFPKIKEQQS